ncbi:MAG: hypothetical protein ABIM98_07395 [candidate division WOR-3 bacterium]
MKKMIKCEKCEKEYKDKKKQVFIKISNDFYLCEDCFNESLNFKPENKEQENETARLQKAN